MKKFLALLCILALALPSALAGDTLTILRMDHDFYPMDENRLQQAQGQLQQAFPGMEVVTRQGIPADAQPFKVDAKGNIKLTNGDLYALISPNLNRLISADALLCLSDEQAMAGLLSALPDYSALWGKEDKVYALPTRLTILLAKPGKDGDLKALGLSPDGWTWQQVFDALPLVKEMNAKNGTDIKLLKENQALFSEKAIAQSLSYWQHGVLLKDTQPKINLSTQQSLMLWQDAIAKGYPDAPLPLMQKLLPLWQQYMAGTLALEPCVEQMLLLLPAAE